MNERILDDNSTQPCGCDKGANWVCEWHREQPKKMVIEEFVEMDRLLNEPAITTVEREEPESIALPRRQHMLLMSGLPGSGKTTFRNNYIALKREAGRDVTYINYDEISRHYPGIKVKELKQTAMRIARESLLKGADLVIDNTNLTEAGREPWKQLAHEFNLDYTNHRMNTPVAECIRRDMDREARVGRAVIETMALHAGMLDLSVNPCMPVILVDMDGTLSDCSHRQHHVTNGNRNWDAFYAGCGEDKPNTPVARLVDYLAFGGDYQVIIISGRPTDKAGIATETWLDNRETEYKHLFMRQRGDSRPDFVVKQEILDSMLKSGLNKSDIAFVLDDRNQVVEMWRRNELPCFQVAPGDF